MIRRLLNCLSLQDKEDESTWKVSVVYEPGYAPNRKQYGSLDEGKAITYGFDKSNKNLNNEDKVKLLKIGKKN